MKESKQFELMKNKRPYQFDEYLDDLQKQCAKTVNKINLLPYGNQKRETLFKKLFNSFGNNNIVKEGFKCHFGFNISIGSNCLLNFNLTILDSYEVVIGNNVFIAPNVVISPVTHSLDSKERRNQIGKKIIIEDDVWIGAGAIILPGVTIHKGAVVGAGAVVNKDVAEKTVVGGIPAKEIKKI